MRIPLILALDDWSVTASSKEEAMRLLECADRADDDKLRATLRKAVKGNDLDTLKRLSAEAIETKVPAINVVMLAAVLNTRDARDEALALLRQSRSLYPSDFWIHLNLAILLSLNKAGQADDPVRLEERIDCLRTAVAVRPQYSGAYYNLGVALSGKKDWDGASASSSSPSTSTPSPLSPTAAWAMLCRPRMIGRRDPRVQARPRHRPQVR